MKVNHIKLVVIALLASLIVTYTNCGKPFSQPTELMFQGNVYGGSSEVSVKAFESSVYTVTRSYCVSCHSVQAPMHAADDVKVAHDAVISAGKVNFTDVGNSRLVKKLRDDNHNCWSDCAKNADEMEAAIEKWKTAIKDSGPATTPTDTAIYTEETSTMEMEFADSSNPMKTNSVKLNVEAAMLKAPMVLTKPEGAEAYLSVPNVLNNTLQANDANAGLAYFNFTVPANGTYRVWGLVYGPADADNAFYVNITNTNTKATVVGGARAWDFGTNTKFEWKQAPNNVAPNLVAGTMYTLELRQRKDGARLAGIIVTSDTNFNGSEIGDYFGITLSFDLSGALKTPGVSFLIDVVDYDPYSYKVSRPRIVSSNANVYAKGLKLLVNNSYNNQHATYTIVDKLTTPADQVLSNYSMIVLKDKGPSGDHIKFSFDQLSVSSGSTTGGGATGTTGGGTGTQTSLVAFQSTVYPISRSSTYSCVGCHMTVSPRHASDNALTAHDAVLTVVDFNNPAGSRIVNKMKVERHNCDAQCDNLAVQYQNAIMDWKNKRQ